MFKIPTKTANCNQEISWSFTILSALINYVDLIQSGYFNTVLRSMKFK